LHSRFFESHLDAFIASSISLAILLASIFTNSYFQLQSIDGILASLSISYSTGVVYSCLKTGVRFRLAYCESFESDNIDGKVIVYTALTTVFSNLDRVAIGFNSVPENQSFIYSLSIASLSISSLVVESLKRIITPSLFKHFPSNYINRDLTGFRSLSLKKAAISACLSTAVSPLAIFMYLGKANESLISQNLFLIVMFSLQLAFSFFSTYHFLNIEYFCSGKIRLLTMVMAFSIGIYLLILLSFMIKNSMSQGFIDFSPTLLSLVMAKIGALLAPPIFLGTLSYLQPSKVQS
jgi:hypothetical protein